MESIKPDWDKYAKNTFNPIIQAHYYFTVWRNYRYLLQGLQIPQGSLLELGSSTGQISLRLAKRYNLSPTLVDSSKYALRLASLYYQKKEVPLISLNKSILNLDLKQKFELVHSHGILEHFTGQTREIALANHIKHVQKGGWLICWVPTPDIFYRTNRWYLTRTGQWIFGFEQPLSLNEFLTFFKNRHFKLHKIRRVPGWIGLAGQNII